MPGKLVPEDLLEVVSFARRAEHLNRVAYVAFYRIQLRPDDGMAGCFARCNPQGLHALVSAQRLYAHGFSVRQRELVEDNIREAQGSEVPVPSRGSSIPQGWMQRVDVTVDRRACGERDLCAHIHWVGDVRLNDLPGTQRIVAIELNVDRRSGGNSYGTVSRLLLTVKGCNAQQR